jgi:hypothetical protein
MVPGVMGVIRKVWMESGVVREVWIVWMEPGVIRELPASMYNTR